MKIRNSEGQIFEQINKIQQHLARKTEQIIHIWNESEDVSTDLKIYNDSKEML